jgi:hypothetical protein
MNQALRQELLALVEEDHGFVSPPEHDPDSDQVQRQRLELLGRLRRRLVQILDTYGWPGKSLVGDDGAEAAWMLALHTMPDPDVLRRCLRLLEDAAAAGEAEPWQVAFLVDRVSLVERNVQVYGTTICGRKTEGSLRRCWKIPSRWMRAARRSGFRRWRKTSAGSNNSTAATSQGTFLRLADMRSQPATISVAASQSTVSWRVVPHPEPPDRPYRRGKSTHTRTHAPQRARLAAAHHAIHRGTVALTRPLHISAAAGKGCAGQRRPHANKMTIPPRQQSSECRPR